jgi:hypothetical protein
VHGRPREDADRDAVSAAAKASTAIVNGAAGVGVQPGDSVVAVVGFTVVGGRIVEMDVVSDPAKLRGVRLEG